MSRALKTVKSNPLAGRIKKVMQTDDDVGKIAQGAPLLLGMLFIDGVSWQFCPDVETTSCCLRSSGNGAIPATAVPRDGSCSDE